MKELYNLTVDCEAVDINPADDGLTSEERMAIPWDLNRFARAVKKALPHCEFSAAGASGYWVYHPKKSLCMGYIGYGDFRVNKDVVRPKTYMVCSRTIENNKYSSYNSQHHQLMSQNLDVAVRNAKKHLRDWNPVEIAGHHGRDCNSKWGETEGDFNQKLSVAERALSSRGMKMLLREVMHLKELGHTWCDPSFSEFTEPWMEARAEKMEALEGRSKGMLFVNVEKDLRGSTLYHTALTADVSDWSPEFSMSDTYTDDTIPEDLNGKLSVLSLCDNGQFVDNVGWRVSETIFYVVQ